MSTFLKIAVALVLFYFLLRYFANKSGASVPSFYDYGYAPSSSSYGSGFQSMGPSGLNLHNVMPNWFNQHIGAFDLTF